MPEAPAPAAEIGGPPKAEAPTPVKGGTGPELPNTRSASLDALQKMGNTSALDALKALGTPTVTRGELADNKPPQADQPTSTLPDLDQPQQNPDKTIEQPLEDLAKSPNTPPSPDEEAAITRAKQILNPDAQNDVTQQNEDFINSAKFTEPSAAERAQGAQVTEKGQQQATDQPSSAATTETSSATNATEAKAETNAADATTPTNEAPADAESPTDRQSEAAQPESVAATAERPQSPAEQLASMAEVGAQLNELGVDLNGQQGKDLLKLLGENPDKINDFKENIVKAKAIGKDLAEALGKHGINLTGEQATTAAVDILIQQLGEEIAEQTDDKEAVANADGGKKGKEILMKILKALALALAVVATAPITVPVLAGVGAGAIAMSKK